MPGLNNSAREEADRAQDRHLEEMRRERGRLQREFNLKMVLFAYMEHLKEENAALDLRIGQLSTGANSKNK